MSSISRPQGAGLVLPSGAAPRGLALPAGRGLAGAGMELRRYRAEDREAVRRVACDNGFLGRPIDAAFSDRALFAAIFIDPYLDSYPDWAFVALHEGAVVGYLTAAVGNRYVGPQIFAGYRGFRRFLRIRREAPCSADAAFLDWLILRSWRERVRRPATPVHMHYGIRAPYRGRRLAHRLWGAFEAELRRRGIPCYYGEMVTDRPEQVIRVYHRYGLSLYDRTRSTMFAHMDDRPVWTLCMTKCLAEEGAE